MVDRPMKSSFGNKIPSSRIDDGVLANHMVDSLL